MEVKIYSYMFHKILGGFASGVGAAGTDSKGTQWFNNGALSFDGVKIFVANGLANNTAIAAEKSNLSPNIFTRIDACW